MDSRPGDRASAVDFERGLVHRSQPPRIRRRLLLGLFAGLPLVGCGGGDGTAEHAVSTDEQEEAASLAHAVSSGFKAIGPSQRVLIGVDEQFFHYGGFSSVLIVPLTAGGGVVAARGVPAVVADDEVVVVTASGTTLKGKVLTAGVARGFNLRCAGLTACSVALYLGA